MKTMFGRMSGTGITPQVRSGLPPTNSPLRDSAPPLTRMTRQPLIRRSVRSRCRASGGRLVSHISRRSTRPAPSPCWIDLSVIKAPAQRPCGRRCRAILGPPPAGMGVVPRGSRPLDPHRRNNLDNEPLDGPEFAAVEVAPYRRQVAAHVPARRDERPLGRLFGTTSRGARPVCPRSDGSRQPSTAIGWRTPSDHSGTTRQRKTTTDAAIHRKAEPQVSRRFRQTERGTHPRLLDVVVLMSHPA
jgi:hypothetical protein